MARIFLVNVGANAGHVLKSPVFPDGSFRLLPIPEGRAGCAPMVRYSDLPYWSGCRETPPFVPPSYRDRFCHFDPEFLTRTYGDDPRRAPRAAALLSAVSGDILLFLARLWDWEGGRFSGGSGFYLVAALEVESILKDVMGPLSERESSTYGANAHVRRAQADAAYWNMFWVFKGTPRSHLFSRAIELTPERACGCLRDKNGRPWVWRTDRTPLQTIGSYTRTIRCVAQTTDPALRAWPEELLAELPL